MKTKSIHTYEWAKLNIGDQGLTESHQKALLKLNELHGFNYLEVTSRGVKFKNYVGIIQVDKLTIEILPKLDGGQESTDWRELLIHMLKVARKVKVHNKDQANVGKRNFHLLDIYLDMFLSELSYLMQRGLVKAYRQNTSNTLALKGKLEMAGHLSRNIIHKERFYTTHQVYDHDTLIHHILSYALDIVKYYSASSTLSSKANRLSLLYPPITKKHIRLEDFKKLHLNRKTSGYKKILEIAKVIIGNYSPDISSGNNKMLALLFNMNHLWEEYLFQSLRKNQHELGYEVVRESKPLFTKEGYNLNPDIVIRKDEQTYILDAKWKRPRDLTASQQDLRQVYTYCRFWKARKGYLVYPSNNAVDNDDMVYADSEEQYSCKLVFLPITLMKNISLDDILGT